MHGYWSGSYSDGWMMVHGAFWIVFLAAVLIGAIYLPRSSRLDQGRRNGSTALELLDQRYAKGEIDREKYLQRKKDFLEGQPGLSDLER